MISLKKHTSKGQPIHTQSQGDHSPLSLKWRMCLEPTMKHISCPRILPCPQPACLLADCTWAQSNSSHEPRCATQRQTQESIQASKSPCTDAPDPSGRLWLLAMEHQQK